MSDNQEQNRPRGPFGNWRSRPLVGGPGVGERTRRRALWPPRGVEEEEHSEGMTPKEAGDVKAEALSLGHEPDRPQMRPVIAFMVGVILLIGLAVVVVSGMQAVMTGGRVQVGLPADGIVQRAVKPEDRDLPVGARARAIPDIELAELRATERELLETYSWTDQANGKARIPVERAMELLLRKGLPTQPNAAPIPQTPRTLDSSAGRAADGGQ